MTHAPRLLRRITTVSLALPLVWLGVGCAPASTNLTVTSLKNHQVYQQQFSKVYAGQSEQGDFDVVLVRDASPGGAGTGVKQVMHIRILWKPMRGTKLDHPTATNAAIDWYVFGDTVRPEMIAYNGAGFVKLEKSGGIAKLEIRSATLTPTTHDPGMADPIGRARLQGTVVAHTGQAERVREVLAEARQVTTEANAARTAAARQASSRAPVEPRAGPSRLAAELAEIKRGG